MFWMKVFQLYLVSLHTDYYSKCIPWNHGCEFPQSWNWISSLSFETAGRHREGVVSEIDTLLSQTISFLFFPQTNEKSQKTLIKSQEWSSGWLSSHQRKCLSIHLMSDSPSACWKDLKAISPCWIEPYEQQVFWSAFLDGFLLHEVKPTWRASSGSVAGGEHCFN